MSDEEIIKSFSVKAKMTVFTWKGERHYYDSNGLHSLLQTLFYNLDLWLWNLKRVT
jgi:hypothetical protein